MARRISKIPAIHPRLPRSDNIMRNKSSLAALLVFTLTGVSQAPIALAQQNTELDSLRQDVETLKQRQDAIQKDVQEIKQLIQQARQGPRQPPPVEAIDATLSIAGAPLQGDKNAKLTLIEFSDYQCPFCKRHEQNTSPQIQKEYIDSGKLRYVFRDFPLEAIHPDAFKAHEAARCAGEQNQYWEMHGLLFDSSPALQLDKLTEYAQQLNLQPEPFKQCLDSSKYADQVRADLAEGQKLGVRGTPTFFLGVSDGDQVKQVRAIRGAMPFTVFKQEIDTLLAPPKP